jgi:tape measure domain-containing protein
MAFDMTTALTIRANVVGQGQVDKFGKSLGNVEKNSNQASTGLRKLAQAGNSLTGVLARVGVAAAAGNFVRAGIEADRTSKRLQNLTREYGETAKVQEFAAEMAGRYGLSQVQAANAVTDLFGRLRPMNVSLRDIETVFKGVNTAAARMNLSTAETDGVMLQLSQALGSGKLQGDEFRSIMERLPAIGQAVAATLKTDVAGLKELSSQGKITTDVIIQALQGLATQQVPEIDAYKRFQAALADLSMTIGTQLLPALTPFIQLANSILGVFTSLPGPLQSIVAGVVALGAGLVVIAPAIPAIIAGFKALAALKIGATIAGFAPVIASVGSALSGLLPILAGVFTGPVGWAALLVGAGAAIYAFRDQIGEVLSGLLQPFKDVFSAIGAAIRAPFETIVGYIKGIINSVLGFVGNAINSAIDRINSLIQGVNNISSKIGIPAIPKIPNVSIPQFAKGGMVNGAQLAVVGEAGPEYIVPAGKAQGFAKNILAGVRGPGAIPAYAEGGYVGPVNITTGPVMQQGGTNYVTMAQFEAGIKDAATAVARNSRSYGARRFTGIS